MQACRGGRPAGRAAPGPGSWWAVRQKLHSGAICSAARFVTPRISIILLNYNTAPLTLTALDSLCEQLRAPEQAEIIVVDNASEIEDLEQLRRGLAGRANPAVRLVCSRLNTGFGGGHMFGAQFARGEYLVFSNSDVRFERDSPGLLVDFLAQHPDAGLAGAPDADASGRVGKAFHHPLSLAGELFGPTLLGLLARGRYPSRESLPAEPIEVGSVGGALLACRAADFAAVGGFDSALFLYYEEKDLSFRLRRQLGKATWLVPEARFTHLHAQSTGSSFITAHELRLSQLYVVRKNLGWWAWLILWASQLLQSAIKAPFRGKHRRLLACYLRGASLSLSMRYRQALRLDRDVVSAAPEVS